MQSDYKLSNNYSYKKLVWTHASVLHFLTKFPQALG